MCVCWPCTGPTASQLERCFTEYERVHCVCVQYECVLGITQTVKSSTNQYLFLYNMSASQILSCVLFVCSRNDTGPYRAPYQSPPEQPGPYPSNPHPAAAQHPPSQQTPQQGTQYSSTPQYYMPPSHYFNSQYYGNYGNQQYHGGDKYGENKYHGDKYQHPVSSVSGSFSTSTTGSYGFGSNSDVTRYHHHQQQQSHMQQQQKPTTTTNDDVPELRRPDSPIDVKPTPTPPSENHVKPDTTTVEFEPPKDTKKPDDVANKTDETETETETKPMSPVSNPQKEDSKEGDVKEDKKEEIKELTEERAKMTPPPALIPVEALSPKVENTNDDTKEPEPEPKAAPDPNAPLNPDDTPENGAEGTPNIAKLEAAVKENLEQAIRQHNQQRTSGPPFDLPGENSPLRPDPSMQDLPRPEELFPFASPTSDSRSPRGFPGLPVPHPPHPHLPFHNIFHRSISDPSFPRAPGATSDYFHNNLGGHQGPGSVSSSSATSLSPPTPLKDPTIPPSFPRPPPSQPMFMSTSASPHKPTDFSKPKTPGVEGSALTPSGEAGELFYCHLCSYVGE